jgi:hypothetical protein
MIVCREVLLKTALKYYQDSSWEIGCVSKRGYIQVRQRLLRESLLRVNSERRVAMVMRVMGNFVCEIAGLCNIVQGAKSGNRCIYK